MAESPIFRSYRTPSGDGQTLVEPKVCVWSKLISENRKLLATSEIQFVDRSLLDLRRSARQEIFSRALGYTRQYAPDLQSFPRVDAQDDATPLLVSGHQPELFHPGVWFKNFLLDASRSNLNGIAINVLIDHDLCRSLHVKYPIRQDGSLRLTVTEIDRIESVKPWELLAFDANSAFRSLPQRLHQDLQSWTEQRPLAYSFWELMKPQSQEKTLDGLVFAKARHLVELQAGLQNLEVPFSHLVNTDSFGLFFARIVSEIESFRTIYNEKRNAYRIHHRIRNQAHPVPELAEQDGWHELPFWIYSKSKPKRSGLWCRTLGNEVELSDRAGWSFQWSLAASGDRCLDQWKQILSTGVCIRPRALTTTMYLRLFASDLFMHGIGGAKYDQLTDMILCDWLGLAHGPSYVVASATVRLGIDIHSDEVQSPVSIRQKWWHDRFHAEQFLHANEGNSSAHRSNGLEGVQKQLSELSRKKLQLLETIPERGRKLDWHHEITDVNRRMENAIEPYLLRLRDQIPVAEQLSRQRAIASSREYSMIIFPEQKLVQTLSKMAQEAIHQPCDSMAQESP